MKFLLIGGDGFLGRGLQDELRLLNINFKSIDKKDYNLCYIHSVDHLIKDLKDITHIVLLASNVGVDTFKTRPYQAMNENINMFDNVIDAAVEASTKYNKKFNFIFYSTSEIFWSLDSIKDKITENTEFNFFNNLQNPRSNYARIKFEIEDELKDVFFKQYFEKILILRPFNISGKYQKRGVFYKMVKSAMENNYIDFRIDTTRSITPDWMASELAVKYILNMDKQYDVKHIVDPFGSCTLEFLAKTIKDILEHNYNKKDIKLVAHYPDEDIKYRHIDVVNQNKLYMKEMFKKIIERMLNE